MSAITLLDSWNAATRTFTQATRDTADPLVYFYRICGHVVRLHFATPPLACGLTPALAHLVTAPQLTADLTINLWDSATTGIDRPALPEAIQQPPIDLKAGGSYLHSERFQAFWQPVYGLFTMLDRATNEAFYWVDDAEQLPLAEGGAPLITLLHWWLGQRGQQIVHGAAIGSAAGGVLLVGKSGSGKSTTALACLHAGLHYVGDDYCAVAATPVPMVYSLYSSGKVYFADLARFPRLQKAQSRQAYAGADKALYFFAEAFANQLAATLPLKAILLPTVHAQQARSQLRAVSPATALLAMGPSTVFQLIGEKRQTIEQLGQLVRQLPCYRLELGADLEAIPALITDVLATL